MFEAGVRDVRNQGVLLREMNATPRIVCDVPYVGKRWVHQFEEYDREHGISYWTKNYRTALEGDDQSALTRMYE